MGVAQPVRRPPKDERRNRVVKLPRRFAQSRLMTVIMMLLGLGFAAGGGWFVYVNGSFMADAQRAAGIVVRLDAKRGTKGMTLYHPVVAFRASRGGRRVTFRSRIGLWPSAFEVGESVTVAYQPGDPGKAKIVSILTLWFLPGCMIGLGLLALVLGRAKLKS